jgi:hypothetical protein
VRLNVRRNRKVGDLIARVEAALESLDEADEAIAHAQEHLSNMQAERTKAVAELATAREALFKEYPELRGEVQNTAPNPSPAGPAGPVDPTKFEPVDVDDENDPRYMPGAPREAIEFQER